MFILFTCFHSLQVSNSYSREVSGHGAIAPHLGKFYGILNGIDPDIWDPYSDNFIPVNFLHTNFAFIIIYLLHLYFSTALT
jgi:starch synthase